MLSLGLNYRGHDSAAALVQDGRVVFAVAEERLSRSKHDGGFPVQAISACLDHVGATLQELDHVSVGWSPPARAWRHDLKNFLSGAHPPSRQAVASSTALFARLQRERGGARALERAFGAPRRPLRFVDHHLAHALSAYALSDMDEATVVVVDGRGAWESTSIWHGRGGRLHHRRTIPWPNSLGLFYAEFTHYLGFQKYSDEWKVMGLAPYGGPGIDLGAFIDIDDHGYRVAARKLLGRGADDARALEAAFGPRRTPESALTRQHKDLAWAVQDACERAMTAIVRSAVAATGCRDLCMAGGVALNSKANGKLQQSGLIDRLFVQPAAADDGVALGAAFAPLLDDGGTVPRQHLDHVYWGPGFDDDAIEADLQRAKIAYRAVDDVAEFAAERLAQGQVVGWFQGRMEFGPRALGARSILADPRDATSRDKVNSAVKFREPWRPFAPAMPQDAAGDWVEGATPSPFMILTFPVRADRRAQIPAVTHRDGSARVQTVRGPENPAYRRLLDAFGRRTGVPVLLNTSFNLRGEAIVHTPMDAVRTFYSSGLDVLVLGRFVVEKAG